MLDKMSIVTTISHSRTTLQSYKIDLRWLFVLTYPEEMITLRQGQHEENNISLNTTLLPALLQKSYIINNNVN